MQRAEDVDGGAGHWTMFSTSIQGQDQPANFFMLPPTAATAIHTGVVIEDVRWIRDPMANMVWAIERRPKEALVNHLLGRSAPLRHAQIRRRSRPSPNCCTRLRIASPSTGFPSSRSP